MKPRVKICGLTRRQDAELAVELGAAAIGVVFWPSSPRVVTVDQAREVLRELPRHVTRVGVFVNASPSDVASVVASVELDGIQLQGDERVEDYASIPARILRAMPLERDEDVVVAASLPQHVTVLVDAADRAKRGGTGQRANWAHAATLAEQRPIMLAGGLTAESVAEAVRAVRPWAVDVSSGVEAEPGVKSADRLRAFFAAVEGS
jgi:phosphoribosylanthranilate isomerase